MRWGQKLGLNPDYTLRHPVWGDGTKWGETSIDASIALSWIIEVDWDNDGFFNGENESGYAFDISVKRGRKFYLNSSGTGFQPVEIGEASISLSDESGRFDTYNTSGDLYGMLLPGRRIRIRVKRESDAAIKDVFIGNIIDIRPGGGDEKTVTITAQDDVRTLKNVKARTGIYTNIRYNAAIENVLSVIEWKGASSVEDTISDTMPYYWASGKPAFDEIIDIVNSTLGLFYISKSGGVVYLDRLNNAEPATEITDADWMRDYGVRIPQPWEVVRNIVRVYARARKAVTGVEVWRMNDTPTIQPGASITIWAFHSYNNIEVPATSITTPVVTTDYTGSISSADISITVTAYAIASKLVITNNNASAQVLTLMKLRGDVITADPYTYIEDTNDDSVEIYGIREFEMQTDWLQDINAATDQVNALLSRLSSAKQFPRLMLRGNPLKQFDAELFDIHDINLVSKNISNQLRVGYIEHKSTTRNLQVFNTIFYYEPNMSGLSEGTWIFPATFGLTTVF